MWEGFTIPLIIQKVQIINIVTKALSCGKEYLSWQSNIVTLYAGRYLTDEIRTGGDNKVFNNFVLWKQARREVRQHWFIDG